MRFDSTHARFVSRHACSAALGSGGIIGSGAAAMSGAPYAAQRHSSASIRQIASGGSTGSLHRCSAMWHPWRPASSVAAASHVSAPCGTARGLAPSPLAPAARRRGTRSCRLLACPDRSWPRRDTRAWCAHSRTRPGIPPRPAPALARRARLRCTAAAEARHFGGFGRSSGCRRSDSLHACSSFAARHLRRVLHRRRRRIGRRGARGPAALQSVDVAYRLGWIDRKLALVLCHMARVAPGIIRGRSVAALALRPAQVADTLPLRSHGVFAGVERVFARFSHVRIAVGRDEALPFRALTVVFRLCNRLRGFVHLETFGNRRLGGAARNECRGHQQRAYPPRSQVWVYFRHRFT